MTNPHARAALRRFAVCFLLTAVSVSCTRVVYMVKNPDGRWTEADTTVVSGPGEHRIVDDGVIIEILTSNDYVLSDGQLPLYVQVTIETASDLIVEDRGPVNIAIIVDRSGSMRGEKLENAKLAARQLVRQLADGDRVALVSYSSGSFVNVPSTTLTAHSRRVLGRAIDQLTASGGTDLSGGLLAGVGEVRRGISSEHLNRVLLLSDGRANRGITDPRRLDQIASRLRGEGISVTTMGLGVDYNEDLMSGLAIAGGGNYYFVERARELAGIFDREMATLASTVTRDMILYLDLPRDVRLQELHGYRWERRGDQLAVHLNSISAGQKRRVLMSLDVPPRAGGQHVVANGRIEYRHEVEKRNRVHTLAPVTVSYTSDRSRVARSLRRKVVEKIELVRNARVREHVISRLDAGDKAGAQRLLQGRLRQSRTVHRTVGGAAIRKQMKELESLASDVQSAPAPGSRPYEAMKKARKAEATRMKLY